MSLGKSSLALTALSCALASCTPLNSDVNPSGASAGATAPAAVAAPAAPVATPAPAPVLRPAPHSEIPPRTIAAGVGCLVGDPHRPEALLGCATQGAEA